MTRPTDRTALDSVLELVAEHGTDAIASAFGGLLQIAMETQRDVAIGVSHHERSENRHGHRNGYKPKTITTRVGEIELQVPKTRGVPFYPDCLERGRRSERAFVNALAEMYVQGVSTRKVAAVVEELCGTQVSSTTVSRAAAMLDEELEAWRARPLGQVAYLILDARYEKVREGGRVISCAILTAIGVMPDGTRSILGVSCSLSEAEVH